MKLRFLSQSHNGRGVVVAAVATFFGEHREMVSLDEARAYAAALAVAIKEAESIDRSLTLTKQSDGSYR